MVIQKSSYPVRTVEHMLDGDGCFVIEDILLPDQMHNRGRLFAIGTLAPGHSVGMHTHTQDMEICFFLSGTGLVEEDGADAVAVRAGDCNIVDVGHSHRIINTGSEDLKYIAVILYA